MKRLISRKKYGGGGNGGKDPNGNKNHFTYYHQCNRNLASSGIVKKYSIIEHVEKNIGVFLFSNEESKINEMQSSHPIYISINEEKNSITCGNVTHDGRFNNGNTILVGYDNNFRPVYSVTEEDIYCIKVIEKCGNNIDLLLKMKIAVKELKISYEKNVKEYNPVQDMKQMYSIIGDYSRTKEIDFDITIETKEEIIAKLSMLIKNIDKRIEEIENEKRNN